ncbi:unnamed protein product [Rotaria socialis]|uniref:Uncharacterized protein n=1 Tax=Rotaria socialis TaxID=392032 RepID=A0A818NY32_9BILA|nr:unnamed protein product [Rotaria socialis]
MPRIRVPIRRTGVRYTARPGRRYPAPPPRAAASGGKGGLLATMGLLGLFASFIAVTAYLGKLYNALKTISNSGESGHYANMAILIAALCFAGYHKLRRSL